MWGSTGRAERSPAESAGGVAAIGMLPLLDLILILGLGVDSESRLALVVLPLAFAAAAYALNRLLEVATAWAVVHAAGCAVACFMAAAAATVVEELFFKW